MEEGGRGVGREEEDFVVIDAEESKQCRCNTERPEDRSQVSSPTSGDVLKIANEKLVSKLILYGRHHTTASPDINSHSVVHSCTTYPIISLPPRVLPPAPTVDLQQLSGDLGQTSQSE